MVSLTWVETCGKWRRVILAPYHDASDGESHLSFLRASETEKRQSIVACSVLRWCSQAAIARVSVASSGIRRSRRWCVLKMLLGKYVDRLQGGAECEGEL